MYIDDMEMWRACFKMPHDDVLCLIKPHAFEIISSNFHHQFIGQPVFVGGMKLTEMCPAGDFTLGFSEAPASMLAIICSRVSPIIPCEPMMRQCRKCRYYGHG